MSTSSKFTEILAVLVAFSVDGHVRFAEKTS
jgi:hypothetical protein